MIVILLAAICIINACLISMHKQIQSVLMFFFRMYDFIEIKIPYDIYLTIFI